MLRQYSTDTIRISGEYMIRYGSYLPSKSVSDHSMIRRFRVSGRLAAGRMWRFPHASG